MNRDPGDRDEAPLSDHTWAARNGIDVDVALRSLDYRPGEL